MPETWALEEWPDTRRAPADTLGAVHDVQAVCRTHESPRSPARLLEETIGWFSSPPDDEARSLWVARDGRGVPEGAAWLSCRADHTAVAAVMVVPHVRARGLGTLLYDAVLEAAVAAGAGTLSGTTTSVPAREFLERRGAVAGHVQVRQLLDLHRPPASRLTPVVAAEPDDPSVLSWEAPTPAHLLAAYALAKDAINDAPMEDFEREVWTPERVAGLERTISARGSQTFVSAVLQGDRILAYTEIRAPGPPGTTAATQDTAVVAAQRRQGYGALVKRASLVHLRDQRPDLRFVTTTNDATNEPMLRINRALGFEPVARQTVMSLVPHPGPPPAGNPGRVVRP
jgi:mycothiol synthase